MLIGGFMNSNWRSLLLILILVALSACSSPAPTAEPSPTAGQSPEYPPPEQIYPAPFEAYPFPWHDAYPSSEQEVPVQGFQYPYPLPGSLPYPSPLDPEEVPFDQAAAMVMNGEVAQVLQTHDLNVILTLMDGRRFITTQPEIDEILKLIDECGEPCEEIVIITE
jgi:hypothetical protein